MMKYFLGKDGDEAASSTEPSNESPILNASFPSKLVFSWFTGFAWMDFKQSRVIQHAWNPVNHEKTKMDGKLSMRIGDSILGSVEDAISPIVRFF